MIPTSFILTATLVFLLFPTNNFRDLMLKNEKEVKSNTSMNVNIHLGSSHLKINNLTDYDTKDNSIKNPNLELPPVAFTEAPLQMEDWMKNAKKWNSNKD
jgi:hypothetical protein